MPASGFWGLLSPPDLRAAPLLCEMPEEVKEHPYFGASSIQPSDERKHIPWEAHVEGVKMPL